MLVAQPSAHAAGVMGGHVAEIAGLARLLYNAPDDFGTEVDGRAPGGAELAPQLPSGKKPTVYLGSLGPCAAIGPPCLIARKICPSVILASIIHVRRAAAIQGATGTVRI
jgi:hypothetical protein